MEEGNNYETSKADNETEKNTEEYIGCSITYY